MSGEPLAANDRDQEEFISMVSPLCFEFVPGIGACPNFRVRGSLFCEAHQEGDDDGDE